MVDIICIADIQLTILYSIIITVLFYEILYQAKWEAQWKILSGTESKYSIKSNTWQAQLQNLWVWFQERKKKGGYVQVIFIV